MRKGERERILVGYFLTQVGEKFTDEKGNEWTLFRGKEGEKSLRCRYDGKEVFLGVPEECRDIRRAYLWTQGMTATKGRRR